MKPQHFALLSLLALSSCAHPLLNPLPDGTVDHRSKTWKDPGAPIHILPGTSLQVHAGENSKIQEIVTGPDSSISIVAKGEYTTQYIHLKSSHVTKGQHVHKGDVIGELYSREEVLSNTLVIYVYRLSNKPCHPRW